ncbi:MAG: hypothetical protein IT566_11195 [Rhodospirillaceae bacterium]|nr:hypothetical protein [Rhodospirillaceae bacterium]
MAETATDQAFAPIPTRKKRGLAGLAWRLSLPVRRLLGSGDVDNSVEAQLAVSYFLNEMNAAAVRTYPAWSRLLDGAFSECALDFDERRALFEVHPIDDYYFAGVVALECARMRGLYNALEASEILGEVGAQVDAAAGRQDRVVSDLVFYIMGKIELGSGVDRMKAPHDKVVKAILHHIGVDKVESTRALMRDKALRHQLGEPLAVGIPQWWKAFQTQFRLYWPTAEERAAETQDESEEPVLATETAEAPTPLRGRRRRRAVAL